MLPGIRWMQLNIRNIMESKHRTYAILSYSNIWYLRSYASNSTYFKMFLNAQHVILYKVMRIHFRGIPLIARYRIARCARKFVSASCSGDL